MAEAYVHFARTRPGLYEATLQAPDSQNERLIRWSNDTITLVARLLAPYELDELNLIHAVRGLRSLMHGFVAIEHAGGFGLPVNLNESFASVIEVYLAGLPRLKQQNE